MSIHIPAQPTNPQIDQWIEQQLLDQNAPPGATATGGTTGAGDAPSPTVYLTPDALMTYIATRLGSVDGQIDQLLSQQQTSNAEQQQISQIQTQIHAMQGENTANSNGTTDKAGCEKLETQIENLVTYMQTNDPGNACIGQLMTLHDTLMATGSGASTEHAFTDGSQHGYYNGNTAGPGQTPNGTSPPAGIKHDTDNTLGDDEMSNASDALTSATNSLNSSAELGMIQLQSLASQRTTAIQLSTNLLQSIDDGLSKIAGNIGH